MIAHVVFLSKEAYVEIKNALPPASCFTNVEEWGFNHIWLRDPTGDIIILTSDPIHKLEYRTIKGFVGMKGEGK